MAIGCLSNMTTPYHGIEALEYFTYCQKWPPEWENLSIEEKIELLYGVLKEVVRHKPNKTMNKVTTKQKIQNEKTRM